MNIVRATNKAPGISGYKKIVFDIFDVCSDKKLRLLDFPTGSGKLADALRAVGHEVICSDIDLRRPDFVFADMNKPLPFSDNYFDGVICLEGIEHILSPMGLISELVRICKHGGKIVLSTPNILNMYSRLQFLFTGTFFQFNPALPPEVEAEEMRDRRHISSLTYYQLRYLFENFGAKVIAVKGDKFKRKVLFPLYLIILAFGWLWARRLFSPGVNPQYKERNAEIYRHAFAPPVLFSRSLIMVVEKVDHRSP